MIPRGKSVDSVEAYYATLKELSAPYEVEYLCWIRSLEYYKEVFPNISEQIDGAIEAYMAEKNVTVPLGRVFKAILSFLVANHQWEQITLTEKHYPLLSVEVIFNCLLKFSEENLQLTLRLLSCTYEQRLQLLSSFKNKDVNNFSSVFNLIDNGDILSDICWDYGLYQPLENPHEQLMNSIIADAINEGHYYTDIDGNYVITDDNKEFTEEEIIEQCNNYNDLFYLKYLNIRRELAKWNHEFYDRERELFQEIINRPEGQSFALKYDNEPEPGEMVFHEEVPAITDSEVDSEVFPDNTTPIKTTKMEAEELREVELHWPTDEELKGYKDNYNGKEYFTNTIFGPAGKVKASVIKELYRVLSGESILKEDIETQLIFLARYTGKEIPGLTLRPIEWHMLDSDGDGAIGYLIYMTTTKHEFVKGERFFYFDYNGVKKTPDSRQIGQIGSRWAQRPEKSTARTRFETALNKFLQEYQSSSEE